jgi:hypothetical protein
MKRLNETMQELNANMSELVLDANARATLQHLVESAARLAGDSPSPPAASPPSCEDNAELMDTNDANDLSAAAGAKQDLLARLSQPLLDALCDSLAQLRTQPSALLFLRVALKFARGEKRSLMCALVEMLNEPFICEPSRGAAASGRRRNAKRPQSHTFKPPVATATGTSKSSSNRKRKGGLVVDAMLAARDRKLKKRRALPEASEAAADAATGDDSEEGSGGAQVHLADSAAGHMVLRRIIEDDAARLSAGDSEVFAHIVIESLAAGSLVHWLASNRACFVLLSLLELNDTAVNKWLHRELSGSLAGWQPQHPGGRLLLDKLQSTAH